MKQMQDSCRERPLWRSRDDGALISTDSQVNKGTRQRSPAPVVRACGTGTQSSGQETDRVSKKKEPKTLNLKESSGSFLSLVVAFI